MIARIAQGRRERCRALEPVRGLERESLHDAIAYPRTDAPVDLVWSAHACQAATIALRRFSGRHAGQQQVQNRTQAIHICTRVGVALGCFGSDEIGKGSCYG